MQNHHFAQLAISACTSLVLTGCVATARRTGYLDNYERLEKGDHVERFWFDASRIADGGYGRIRLSTVDTSRIRRRPFVTPEDCVRWLRESIVTQNPDDLVLSISAEGGTALLEAAVTEMNPGNADQRIIAGELGWGHAYVQVEGRVLDPESGELLAVFTDRRRGSGVHGFRDVLGDSGPAMVREMLQDIGRDLKKELEASFASARKAGGS